MHAVRCRTAVSTPARSAGLLVRLPDYWTSLPRRSVALDPALTYGSFSRIPARRVIPGSYGLPLPPCCYMPGWITPRFRYCYTFVLP